MKYKVLTPQADNLMESTRSIGYSLQSAIADIVDNSIAAKAKKCLYPISKMQSRIFKHS